MDSQRSIAKNPARRQRPFDSAITEAYTGSTTYHKIHKKRNAKVIALNATVTQEQSCDSYYGIMRKKTTTECYAMHEKIGRSADRGTPYLKLTFHFRLRTHAAIEWTSP